MKSLKLEDFAPLTGVAAVIFLAVAVISFGSYDYFPTSDRTVEIFSTVADRSFTIVMFGTYAGLALMWFSGSLFGWLKKYESGAGRLAATALVGGAVSGGGLMVAYSVIYFAAGQVHRPGGLDPSEAWVMYSLYTTLMGFLHGLILMIGATGLVALRTKALPAWFGWVSLVIAVGMASPVDYVFEGIALAWLVVASLWFFMRGIRQEPHTGMAAA